jgi:hypothetical protein
MVGWAGIGGDGNARTVADEVRALWDRKECSSGIVFSFLGIKKGEGFPRTSEFYFRHPLAPRITPAV